MIKSFKQYIREAEGDAVSGAVSDQGALKYVQKAKDQSKGKYAFVSNKDPNKVFQYFDHMPSEAEADEVLRRVKSFS